MRSPETRQNAYIVTIRRSPTSAREGYYILGFSADQAKYRALRLAKATDGEIIEILAA
jgi:hypothetical protein